jgi:hypothetical protein
MQISKFSIALCVLALGITFAARADDTPAQAAARAAVAAKLNELAQTPFRTNMVNVVPPPVETNSMPTASMEMTNAPMVQPPAAMTSDISQNAPAMQTNSLPTPTMENTNAPAPPTGLTITNAPPAPPENLSVITNAPPMTAPALPISATKAEKLEALTAKYKMDQISPEEYFKQRAAILNGE